MVRWDPHWARMGYFVPCLRPRLHLSLSHVRHSGGRMQSRRRVMGHTGRLLGRVRYSSGMRTVNVRDETPAGCFSVCTFEVGG